MICKQLAHEKSRGYFVSTIGLDEDMIKQHVKYQEQHESKSV
jgi:putative transposase